jgi:hypothetical protein
MLLDAQALGGAGITSRSAIHRAKTTCRDSPRDLNPMVSKGRSKCFDEQIASA